MSLPTFKPVNIFGMEMDEWTYESCTAHFGTGPGDPVLDETPWATLNAIESAHPGRGHATALLTAAKAHYEAQGRRVGGTIALNDRMRTLYQRLGYLEYTDRY